MLRRELRQERRRHRERQQWRYWRRYFLLRRWRRGPSEPARLWTAPFDQASNEQPDTVNGLLHHLRFVSRPRWRAYREMSPEPRLTEAAAPGEVPAPVSPEAIEERQQRQLQPDVNVGGGGFYGRL